MRLVYLSPVPWSSFAQRPHKFVEWFHSATGGDVLWIDPYATRLPSLGDFRRLALQDSQNCCNVPSWLQLIQPSALPIEPLPGSGWINSFLWTNVIDKAVAFTDQKYTLVAIGKPSLLALAVLKRLNLAVSVYDAMDDFPCFYSGLSRIAMRWREKRLIGRATHVFASATSLTLRWGRVRPDVQLVHNGLDANVLPPPKIVNLVKDRKIFGYVGTIGAWFDWEWITQLAVLRPNDLVRLIGPIFKPPSKKIPPNVEILPPCSHHDALIAMQEFDIGLIPFKKNDLTASVDPIKYYEYRALGLPVVSTDFGEMIFRRCEEGTFLSMGINDVADKVERALLYRADAEFTKHFIANNTWETRFAASKII